MLHRLPFAGIAAIALAGACGDDVPPDPPPPLPTQAELFAADQVWDLDIELSFGAIDDLRSEPRVYVSGDVVFEGHRFENVGVRLKGGFSFQNLGGKSSFKIDFNQYDPGRRFLGLENITLNNMRQDRAFVHERLTYELFGAHGLQSPRSGYMRVTVNDILYGLYANVETVDDRFLRDHYGNGDGNLYEAGIGDDLEAEDLLEFEQDEGDDTSRADLMDFIDWANRDGDDVFFHEDSPLDTEQFLGFAAAEAAVGHWDGYRKPNNYRIYHEPGVDKWTFIPWGTDQTWDRDVGAFDGGGVLLEKCFDAPACLAEYVRVATDVLDTYGALELGEQVEHFAGVVDEAALEDPRKPFVYEKYLRHQDEVRAYVPAHAARLRAQLDCVEEGVEVDRDLDGYGACFDDCDDSSDRARPGGVEICDGLDNDCNGFVDDLSTCPCEELEVDDVEFLLCANAVTWSRARNHCEARGGTLARIDSADENERLFEATQALVASRWYIGFNDRDEEEQYRWLDDDDVGFSNWALGDPDDFGEEDCAVLDPFAAGGWTDVPCSSAFPYVCRMDSE